MVDHTGNEVTDLYPVEAFDQQLIPGQIDDLIHNETLMETILPNMISAATKIAEALGSDRNLKWTTKNECSPWITKSIDLNRCSKKNKHIRPEEIRIAIEEQTSLATLIRDARIRLDALQLIRKGDF